MAAELRSSLFAIFAQSSGSARLATALLTQRSKSLHLNNYRSFKFNGEAIRRRNFKWLRTPPFNAPVGVEGKFTTHALLPIATTGMHEYRIWFRSVVIAYNYCLLGVVAIFTRLFPAVVADRKLVLVGIELVTAPGHTIKHPKRNKTEREKIESAKLS